ncbi:unnamed protein product [Durusdinium trenchii]|uniref:Uncharacterized protein n=1 Tax=Durusdinium trenchii TaxID=1381693 RepID=A0ABP0JDW5_9DINO
MGCALCRRRRSARVCDGQLSLSTWTQQMAADERPGGHLNWQKAQSSRSPVQDFVINPLLQPPSGETWVSSPSVLEIDGYVHLWVSISAGIVHFVSTNGLSDWRVVELTVDSPGASGPCVCWAEEGSVVYLFYEQADRTGSFHSVKVKCISARLPSAAFSAGDWLWSSEAEVLEPELEWEKVQIARVGHPFVIYSSFRDQWLLFYSASVSRRDSKNLGAGPLYVGVAAAGEVQGPYRRVLEKKPMMGTADGSPQVVGAGSFKMIKGFDDLKFDDEAGIGRRLLGLWNRITRGHNGVIGSSIALMASVDGFSWSVIDADFLAPTLQPGSWKKAHVHAFDTMIPSFDPDHVFIYYDARDDYKSSKECVGVSRVPITFLDSIASTTATRVGA